MSARSVVLVVDDEPSLRFTLRAILEREGAAVLEAEDGERALEILRERPEIQLVLSDLKMPRLDGMGLLNALQQAPWAPRLVMITAHGDERLAVQAIKAGALDYFSKPFEASDIVRVVRRCLETVGLASENRQLRARLALSKQMVFESEPMVAVASLVERVAARDVTVLVVGESGTGKELVARALVEGSPRADQPFIRFNCAALPRELAEAELFGHKRGAFTGATEGATGLFRAADGGTILLDEIDSLHPQIQGSLLRVLQERVVRPIGETTPRPVDVRLVAATSKDLATVDGFRQDLFYRLNVVVARLPPLRDRRADIPPLVAHFARRYGEQFGIGEPRFSDRVLRRLQDAPWRGNVRELQHTIERLCVLASGPEIDDDPFPVPGTEAPVTLKARVDAFERKLVDDALRGARGNQSECARRLGISRPTLISKLDKYGLR